MRIPSLTLAGAAAILLAACTTTTPAPAAQTEPTMPAQTLPTPATIPETINTPVAPTAEEAAQFVDEAEARLAAMNVDAQRASWVQSTYITYDTQILAARENEKLINAGVELAKRAARFDGLELPYDVRRKL
jgi:peptidyl-dipeptidase A